MLTYYCDYSEKARLKLICLLLQWKNVQKTSLLLYGFSVQSHQRHADTPVQVFNSGVSEVTSGLFSSSFLSGGGLRLGSVIALM